MAVLSAQAPLWRDRRFSLLLSARVISILGNGFARVALAFAVLALPGADGGQLSLVLGCQAFPQLAFVLVGGVLADRISRTRVMALSDVLGACAYGGLALMVLTGRAPLVAMCALAVVAGTASALFGPALSGVVPMLVPADRLQQANGVLRAASNSAMLLGVALSGVTVALVGAGWALVLNAASFVVSAMLTFALRVKSRGPLRETSSGWTDLREGWQEFASRQWLWVVVAQYAFVVAALNANLGVLGPLVAQQYLGGPRSWSVIVGAQALGTIAGAGLAARLRVRRPLLVAVLATFPAAVPIALLGFRAPVWLVAVAIFCSGLAADVFGVLWSTTLQREVPEAALSRVSSYDMFGSLAFAPVGLLVAGPIASAVGTTRSLAGCAAIVVLATAAALLSPQVRQLRAPSTVPRGHGEDSVPSAGGLPVDAGPSTDIGTDEGTDTAGPPSHEQSDLPDNGQTGSGRSTSPT